VPSDVRHLPPLGARLRLAFALAITGACACSTSNGGTGGGASNDAGSPDSSALGSDAGEEAGTGSDSGRADSGTESHDTGTAVDGAPLADSGNTVDAGSPQPVGNIPGTWTLAFDDEFEGASLDATKWTTMQGGGWGSTTCETANVSVSGGNLVLVLASKTSGACVCTGGACAPAFGGSFSAGSGSYSLPVGGYTEARVDFAGSGMNIDNWPAWWTSGPSWPAGGEHDIAEGLGPLTITYHSPSGAHGQGSPAGNWASSFHVYGLYRMASSAQVYYDGNMVASYSTDDDGMPQSLLFDVMDGYGAEVYGSSAPVLVDYVRAWQ
jgi:hypothetical protein